MFQPKLRRALASAALVSALGLLASGTLSAEPREGRAREGREAALRASNRRPPISLWDVFAGLLAKASVRIDPDGNNVSVRIDPDGKH